MSIFVSLVSLRRPLLFFLSFWIFLLIGILPTKASSVHAGSSSIGSGKRVISSYSGGTSVQERAVEEPEDEQADPDGDRNSNFFEFAFGGDPLNHPDSSYLDVGTYDNWARVAIRERMSDAERLAYISANSSLEAEYVRGSDWGGGVGGILYTARGSVLSWAHYNGRGDVTVRSSATGALTYAASYEAYGTRTQEAGANADRQRANTKDEDPTGLLNEGMRYRDLETGLFISRDPMGFVDGPNVYTYVVQNPWSAFDPDGLFLETLWDIGNVIHDVGRAAINVGGGIGGVASYAYGAATGDRFLQETAVDSLRNTASNLKESAIDFSVDIAATAIPFVPAGASKALRATDEIHDASKIAGAAKLTDEAVDLANSARKNVDEVAEGAGDAQKSGGRKGNASTRDQNQELADRAEAAGEGTHTAGASLPEQYYPNPSGGRKGGRYSDVEITSPDKTKRVINTVDSGRDGLPTDREIEAGLDIYERLDEGDTLELIPK